MYSKGFQLIGNMKDKNNPDKIILKIIIGIMLICAGLFSLYYGVFLLFLLPIGFLFILLGSLIIVGSVLNSERKLKAIKVVSFILAGLLVMYTIVLRIYTYPDYLPIWGKVFYPSIHGKWEDSFLPEELPNGAKKMKWFSFPGLMQARSMYNLSFIADDDFFIAELEDQSHVDVYLWSNASSWIENQGQWKKVSTDYTGKILGLKQLREKYNIDKDKKDWQVDLVMDLSGIKRDEYPDTCIYVVDEYHYMAYSEASKTIIYHGDFDSNNRFGARNLRQEYEVKEVFHLTLNEDMSITRDDFPGYRRLNWHIELDGKQVLDRAADKEMVLESQYQWHGGEEGMHTIYLTSYIDGEYRRVSNIIEYKR